MSPCGGLGIKYSATLVHFAQYSAAILQQMAHGEECNHPASLVEFHTFKLLAYNLRRETQYRLLKLVAGWRTKISTD
jgi:hypothetical protein